MGFQPIIAELVEEPANLVKGVKIEWNSSERKVKWIAITDIAVIVVWGLELKNYHKIVR